MMVVAGVTTVQRVGCDSGGEGPAMMAVRVAVSPTMPRLKGRNDAGRGVERV